MKIGRDKAEIPLRLHIMYREQAKTLLHGLASIKVYLTLCPYIE